MPTITRSDDAPGHDPVADRYLMEGWLPRGATLTTKVLHTTPAFKRSVLCLVAHEGRVIDITPWVARALNVRFDRDRGGVWCYEPVEMVRLISCLLYDDKDAIRHERL